MTYPFLRHDISASVDFYLDRTRALAPWDIASREYENSFMPSPGFMGFTDSIVWFRFSVVNHGQYAVPWVLECDSHVDDIRLFRKEGQDIHEIMPPEGRISETGAVVWENPFFLLNENPGGSTYYLAVKSRIAFTARFRAWDPDFFNLVRENRRDIFWVFFGVLMTMAIYNLILSLTIRISAYRYLAMVIGFYCLALFIETFHWKFVAALHLQGVIDLTIFSFALISLSVSSTIRFTRSFLGTRGRSPGLDRFLAIIQYLSILMALVQLVVGYTTSSLICRLIMVIHVFLALFVAYYSGIYHIARGSKGAVFYTIALSLFIITFFSKAAGVLGLFRSVEYWITFLGFTLTNLMLSLGISGRIERIWSERFHAMVELEKTKSELELKVEERTRKLSDLNISLIREIDERKRVADALHRSEEYLLAVFSSASVGIGLARSDGIFVNFNDTLVDMVGYTAGELMELGPQNVIHRDDYKRVMRPIDSVMKGESHPLRLEARLIRKDGTTMWASMSVSPLRDPSGIIEGVLIVFIDITDQKEAELALNRSEKHFRELVNNLRIVIMQWGTDGTILFLNPFGLEYFGYTEEEILGRNVSLITPDIETGGRNLRKLLDDIALDPDVYPVNENEVINRAGERLWCAWTNTPIRDEEGNILYILSSGMDVTEIRRIRDELEKANRAKSEFLANMSHEIRTPLNAVLGFSDLLAGMVRDDIQKSYIDAVKTGGRNLLMLLDDILDLSKIEAGRMDIHPGPVSIETIVEEVRDIFSLKVAHKGLDFIMDIAHSVPSRMMLDEVRMRQILFNLAGNAVKFTHSGHIGCYVNCGKPVDGRVDLVISIEDTGIGISPENMELIFESFMQVEANATKTYGGTGLGLTITRRLVEMMGGEITVKSEPGAGSVFTVTIHGVVVPEGISSGEQPVTTAGEELSVNGQPVDVRRRLSGFMVAPPPGPARPSLAALLRGDMMDMWKTVRDRNIISEIRAFAVYLEDLGIREESESLVRYASALAGAADNFDIDNMIELLELYPLLAGELCGGTDNTGDGAEP